MKWALFLPCALATLAASGQQIASSQITASEPTVTERGANHRIWERTVDKKTKGGFVEHKKQSFTEVANGICYLDGDTWVDADPQVVIAQDGSAMTQNAAHSARFLADIS